MGSTLEHGIYLPSEGEKNCYQGLAGNWQAVDTNIGYVTALRQAIAGALTRQIVTQLPTEDIDPNCIYMILKATAQTNNIYDEYMYINSSWELIGDSQLDLSNYYTKQEVNQLPAVASGVTSTKVGNYDAHIANGDIHVTASDKAKWNTVALIKQLRLVNAQVGSATTIAFANIDDTNGIKVGDKCMDLDGKMFEITAVDATNETVTVGSALVDLALDGNVVHTSGNETVGGSKTFTWPIAITSYPCIRMYLSDDEWNVQPASAKQSEIRFTDKNAVLISYITFQHRTDANEPFRTCWRQQKMDGTSGYFSVNFNNLGEFYPENNNLIKLGKPNNRWLGVYAMSYYYGNDNVEFSTKFVTTDTNQTISGNKTFSSTPVIYNSDANGSTQNLYFRNQLVTKGDTSTSGSQLIRFSDSSDKMLSRIQTSKVSNGSTTLNLRADTVDTNNNDVTTEIQLISGRDGSKSLSPQNDNAIDLGRTLAKWKNLYINQINGLTPSILSLPNYAQRMDISGYITDLSGGNNTYTPIANGYIYLRTDSGLMLEILDATSGIGSSSIVQSSDKLRIFLPVVAQRNVYIKAKCTSLVSAVFVPCFGNL